MTNTSTDLRDALQQALNGSSAGPALLRRLVSHDEWRMPINVDAGGKSHIIYVKDTNGQRFQLLYSDERGYRDGVAAIGQALLGERVLTTNGRALFADIGEDADILSINWGSPPEVFFRKPQFAGLRRWARAVAVERSLASPRPDLSLLKHFDEYYIVLQKIEGGYGLTLAPDGHNRKIATVFTAEDNAEAFVRDQRAGQMGFEPVTRTIPGQHLFEDLKDLPLDGIVFNYSGPVPRRMFIAQLAGAVMDAP